MEFRWDEYVRQSARLNEKQKFALESIQTLLRSARMGGLQMVLMGSDDEECPFVKGESGIVFRGCEQRAFAWVYCAFLCNEIPYDGVPWPVTEDLPMRPFPYCVAYSVMELAHLLPEEVRSQPGSTVSERIDNCLKSLK
jgi:hypothetical protein